MYRAMAFDYGLKRIGIAVTDPNKIIAFNLQTVNNKNIFNFIKNYFNNNHVDTFIIGIPVRFNKINYNNLFLNSLNKFIKSLHSLYKNVKIDFIDEKFTSLIATQHMKNLKKYYKSNHDKYIDQISATIILQDWLNYKFISK